MKSRYSAICLSSQTYGTRFAGAGSVSKGVTLSYQPGYARQLDYHRNPNDYHASYYLADATLDFGTLKVGGGYEVLGAAGGTALTSFQTPLATAFKFQGWADKFLTTPANGIHDRYGSARCGWKKIGVVDALSVQAIYHDFRSDRLDQHYGTAWDLLAAAKIGRATLSARYADYAAKTFATDTRKFWLQATGHSKFNTAVQKSS